MVNIYDPHINEYDISIEKILKNSSLVLILADHDEFKNLNFDYLIKYMDNPIIFDTKNIIDSDNIPNEISLFNFGNIYFEE